VFVYVLSEEAQFILYSILYIHQIFDLKIHYIQENRNLRLINEVFLDKKLSQIHILIF
jgi:hypothetical protein